MRAMEKRAWFRGRPGPWLVEHAILIATIMLIGVATVRALGWPFH